jgi:hypothetical protein
MGSHRLPWCRSVTSISDNRHRCLAKTGCVRVLHGPECLHLKRFPISIRRIMNEEHI